MSDQNKIIGLHIATLSRFRVVVNGSNFIKLGSVTGAGQDVVFTIHNKPTDFNNQFSTTVETSTTDETGEVFRERTIWSHKTLVEAVEDALLFELLSINSRAHQAYKNRQHGKK